MPARRDHHRCDRPGQARGSADTRKGASASLVSLWRFDPDTRKLRVTLSPPQSRPFALLVRSQVATGPLPFEQSVGLLSVDNAAGQIGLLGIATGNEVQLDTVSAETFSPINLEDFPGDVAQSLQAQIPGLTVRRAFRYADAKATASLKASPSSRTCASRPRTRFRWAKTAPCSRPTRRWTSRAREFSG